MKALSPRVPFPYVCESDRALPKEQQTTFQLCGLSFAEQCYLEDAQFAVDAEGTGAYQPGAVRRIVLKCGLRGWDNLDGIKFEEADEALAGATRKRPTDAVLERLDLAAQRELVATIRRASSLQDADRKNS